ncbi:MAG TPA: alpha-D-glucose phosphate-specific phosphoglucomutase, partial [Myxococcota bacterium]|nr:alpha-D-glucose phosphate-specific phosphoglucomutase [Myxococcota bacterium]
LIKLKDRFDIAFACDTDHDRHGIVTRKAGLLTPNHYLSVALFFLFQHRPNWPKAKNVGKTVVTTQMIDRLTAKFSQGLFEVPVGFKWYVDGLLTGMLQFCGEASAGAAFSRLDGTVWTSDKDGIIPGFLAAEISAKLGRDLGDIYHDFENEFGAVFSAHHNTKANAEQKEILKKLSASEVKLADLAGDKIEHILTKAPGNDAPIDGLKVMSKNGWFVARPSGTEEMYEVYAESFQSEDHLNRLLEEAETIVNHALGASTEQIKQV